MLSATYELADLEPGVIVDLRETRGAIRVKISRTATLDELIPTLNSVSEQFFSGAQWFQLWKGEIVTMDSPANPNEGGTVARLHRGPLVQEGSRRSGDGKVHAG